MPLYANTKCETHTHPILIMNSDKMLLWDFYKSRYKKTNDPEDWKQFQHFRNKINTERRKKKTEYFNKIKQMILYST